MRPAAATQPTNDADTGLSAEGLDALMRNHARFLSFLERRVGRRDVAEEILQEAFVRGIDRGGSLRSDESAVAWFYRLLRNALIDHFRRTDAERRALDAVTRASQAEPTAAADDELMDTVCACVNDLVSTLRPAYAEAVRRVDLEGAPVDVFAAEVGVTAGNAAVRLHRARHALRARIEQACGTCATHGCWQCECADEHADGAR